MAIAPDKSDFVSNRSAQPLARLCLLLATVAMWPAAGAAQVGEAGSEIWADGPLEVQPGSARYPDAAVDQRGRSIFVWASSGGSGNGDEVFLRVVDTDGASLVGPTQVNTYDAGNQQLPAVAVQPDNSFLVIWQSWEPPVSTPNVVRQVVRSQAYDAAGQKVGGEQLLSQLEPLGTSDISADVAVLIGGGYITCWQSSNTATPGFNNVTIQLRRVNDDGTPNGDQYQANSLYAGSVGDCDVAPLLDGGFVVTWAGPEIHARRFNAAGDPVGSEVQVNTIDINTPRDETAVASADDGRLLVVWTDGDEADNSTEIRGRMLSTTAVPQAGDFRVNSLITGVQDWPVVAGYGNNFLVAWQSATTVGNDAEPYSIQVRLVAGTDQFLTAQLQANLWTDDSQTHPGIGGANGRAALGWASQSNAETTQNVVLGRIWNVCGIFCDSFE